MALEIIFYMRFLIVFVIKSPIIPLHACLLDTYKEALLARILLKIEACELVRINMKLLSHTHSIFCL